MKNLIIKSSTLILLVIVVFSCGRENLEPEGPNIIDRFGPFEVVQNLSVSTDSVNFSNGERVTFSAMFNKNVEWQIAITGQASGAVKIIEGFDETVNESNAIWVGGTTELPFFRNELCKVELTVLGEADYVDSAFVNVTGTKIFEGMVFADFEEDFTNDGIQVLNVEFDFENDSTGRKNYLPAAEGEYFLAMTGIDVTLDNFFVGLTRINAGLVDSTYIPLPSTVPEDVYFNCFIYGDGRPFTTAVIEFRWDSNDNGRFDDTRDGRFKYEDVVVDWKGWRLVSHSMADAGFTQEQLEKLIAIDVLLIDTNPLGTTPTKNVAFGMDYITFTKDRPFEL